MERPDNIQSILIIRSATHPFHRAIDFFKGYYPNAEISVLAPQEFAQELKNDSRIREVIPSSHKGHFSFLKLERDIKRKLKSRKYDLAVTLYNNKNGMGYLNVDMIALFSRAKYKMAYNSENKCLAISRGYIIKKFILEGINNIFSLFSVFLFSVVFMILTIGLLAMEGLRKLYLLSPAKHKSAVKNS